MELNRIKNLLSTTLGGQDCKDSPFNRSSTSGRGGTLFGIRAGTKIGEFKDLGGLGKKKGIGRAGELTS